MHQRLHTSLCELVGIDYPIALDPDLVEHPALAVQVARLSEDERADYLDKA